MIFIDYEHNLPPQALIDEGRNLTEQLMGLQNPEQRSEFIRQHSDYWGKLKKHLSSLSFDKCWYTEARDIASIKHVDHFRPKNRVYRLTNDRPCETDCNLDAYWWLAFSFENYRLSCSIPNTTKTCYFPLRLGSPVANTPNELRNEQVGLLDPTVREDVLWLTFQEDGKVYPACDDDTCWEAKRVYLSKRVYNLDAQSLVDARIEIQIKCKLKITRIINLWSDKENNNNPLVQEHIKSLFNELREMIDPKAELSAVAKCYILNYPKQFIKQIITM